VLVPQSGRDFPWLRGARVVARKGGSTIIVREVDHRGQPSSVQEESVDEEKASPVDSLALDGAPDLAALSHLNDASILHCLRIRFGRDEIYTNVGSILVAVNPFKLLPLYTPEILDAYKDGDAKTPHVFSMASEAYWALRTNQRNQSCIISGESGSGKTETTKLLLQFLTELSESAIEVENDVNGLQERILQANPLMESFGNAKTVRNDNSSRFGKFIEIKFDKSSGSMTSATIKTYLLEKSRIVSPGPGERNYHIFYQLCAAAQADSSLQSGLHLTKAEDFNYLSETCFTINGVNDEEEWRNVIRAFSTIGVSEEDRAAVERILAAILHLGNIQFQNQDEASGDGKAVITNIIVLEFIADLMSVSVKNLERVLTMRSFGIHSVIFKPFTADEASDARDALAKALYSLVFDWLIDQINKSLSVDCKAMLLSIGILDIFGFEMFENNSFEQFCINFCNEKLQEFFNKHIFEDEVEEYKLEEVTLDDCIDFADNQQCVEALAGKGTGIFAMIDEEISIPKGSEANLLKKILARKSGVIGGPSMKMKNSRTSFIIHHYAGSVAYNVEGFLEKSKDLLHMDLQGCLFSSADSFLEKLANKLDEESPVTSKTKSKSKKKTLGSKFQAQLRVLVSSLEETEPHFVRCVKPNDLKSPNTFDCEAVMPQLRCAGLVEVCKLRGAFPIRLQHRVFRSRYAFCCGEALEIGAFCEEVLSEENFRLGKTKVFLKHEAHKQLEAERQNALGKYAVKIQSAARCRASRKKLTFFKRILCDLASAKDEKALKEAISSCSELPFCGINLKQMRVAKARLGKMQEFRRIRILLREALGSMKERELRIALKAAEKGNLPKEDELYIQTLNALNKVHEAQEIREKITHATGQKNLQALVQLLRQATTDFSMSSESESVIRRGLLMKTRLETEAELLNGLHSMLETNLDADVLRKHLKNLAEIGVKDSEDVLCAKGLLQNLKKYEEAVQVRDFEAARDALQNLRPENHPEDANTKLQSLEAEFNIREALQRNASIETFKKLVSNAPKEGISIDLLQEAKARRNELLLLEEIAFEMNQGERDVEKLSGLTTKAFNLGMTSKANPILERACSALSSRGRDSTRLLRAVSDFVNTQDLEGLRGLDKNSQAVQKAIQDLEEDLEFAKEVAKCDTVQSVEAVCMKSVSNKAKTTLEAARRVEKLVTIQEFAKAIECAEAAGLSKFAGRAHHEEKLAENQKQTEHKLKEAMEANDRNEVWRLLQDFDQHSNEDLFVECQSFLNRCRNVDKVREDLGRAVAKQELDFLSSVLDRCAQIEIDVPEEALTLLEKLKKQREQFADVYSETMVVSGILKGRAKIRLDALEGLSQALAAHPAELDCYEIQKARKVIQQAKHRIQLQHAAADAIQENSYPTLRATLDRLQEIGLQDHTITDQVKDALQLVHPDEGDILEDLRGEEDEDEEEEEKQVDICKPSNDDEAIEMRRREQEIMKARDEKRERASADRYDFTNFWRIRSDDEFAKGLYLNKAKAIRNKLNFQNNPIHRSLLRSESKEINKISIRAHKAILGYCKDKAMSFPSTMAQTLLENGLVCPELIDEIYVLLFKHLSSNERPESVGRGWQLVCMVCSTFVPSEDFEMYAMNFLLQFVDEEGLVGNYARFALRRLEGLLHDSFSKKRREILHLDEIRSYNDRPPILARIQLVNGAVLCGDLPVPPHLDVASVCEMCCHFLGMKDPRRASFGLALQAGSLPLRGSSFLGDVYVEIENQEHPELFLTFKRVAVIKGPIEDAPSDSDPVFNKLMFFETLNRWRNGDFETEASNEKSVELEKLLAVGKDDADGQVAFWSMCKEFPSYGRIDFTTNNRGRLSVDSEGLHFENKHVAFENVSKWGGNAFQFVISTLNPCEEIFFETSQGVHIGGAIMNFIREIMRITGTDQVHDNQRQ